MDESMLSDAALVMRCQHELPETTRSFEELVRRYTQRIYTLVFRIVANREEAEDITQDVLLKAYHSLPQLKHPAQFSTWLYRMATNAALDSLERRRRHPWAAPIEQASEQAQPSPAAAVSLAHPEEQLLRNELRDCINTVLCTLEREQAQILVMRELEELSYDDIARTLDVSLGAIKMRLHRARLAFQRLFLKLCSHYARVVRSRPRPGRSGQQRPSQQTQPLPRQRQRKKEQP
ncbi:MAG: sigma-70 family RNA polymerase sigma factor [Thermogemmatispora sp.]|uniref:sigma-70 family RNA polymerase sigma factor n=1 Tax=Thermogemmatispora sp. TaxID=1968838 RepID=UPI002603A623|nr:sigma-70 family RNA polymerase sigma factor [Thermogemmatispora sp.]MBX5456147.1 sigma-70 family RNA polymerase sigma factor [Thermogemmatispora sp.]